MTGGVSRIHYLGAVELADWVGAIAGTITAIPIILGARASFRRKWRRRKELSAVIGEAGREPQRSGPYRYDVFISATRADADMARRVIADLESRHGLRVYPEPIPAGEVRVDHRSAGISGSANGALLFSAAAKNDRAIMDEYAAMLTTLYEAAPAEQRLFVPVQLDETALPLLARIREPVDLTERGGQAYDRQLGRLAEVLRPERAADLPPKRR